MRMPASPSVTFEVIVATWFCVRRDSRFSRWPMIVTGSSASRNTADHPERQRPVDRQHHREGADHGEDRR